MAIEVPRIDYLSTILPEEPLLMMGAGPVPIPNAVAAANGIVINHLGKAMARVTDQVQRMGRYINGGDQSGLARDQGFEYMQWLFF